MHADKEPLRARLSVFTLSLASMVAVLAGCQTVPPTSPEVVGEYRKGSGTLNGLEAFKSTRALRDTPR